jgi:hypothetical protein
MLNISLPTELPSMARKSSEPTGIYNIAHKIKAGTLKASCLAAKFLAGLWIRIRCLTGFNDFVDPDPDWESGFRIQIQGQEN